MPRPTSVVRFSQVRRFYDALRTRRGDVAWVGDSNLSWTVGAGYAAAAEAELHRRVGLYATGVYPGQPFWVRGYGHRCGFDTPRAAEPVPPADPAFPYLPPGPAEGGGFAFHPAAFVNNVTPGDFAHGSARLAADHPRITYRTRWRFVHATYAAGGGVVQPAAWRDGTLTWLTPGTPLDTTTGTDGLAEHAVEVPADPVRTFGVNFQYSYFFGPAATGPFVALWQRLEWPDVPRGAAVSMLWQFVGQTAAAALAQFAATTQPQFDAYANLLVGPQGPGRKLLLVPIAFGTNDYNAGHAPTQVAANVAGVVARIRALWSAAGHDVDDLYFRTGPYHPLEGDRGRWQQDLDDALAAHANGEVNVAHAIGARATSAAFLRARGAYEGPGEAPGGDTHLTAAGYALFGGLAANAELPAAAVLVRHAAGGAALDLKLFDVAGQVWDAAANSFGPWADADLANYCVPGQELGGSRVYRFELPPDLPPAAVARGDVTSRAGAAPALGDAPVAALGPADFAALGQDGALAGLADGQSDAARQLGAIDARTADALAALDAPVSRAGTGSGTIPVDHDTGGPDALRYVDGQSAGVAGATVRAYVRAEYDAGVYAERGRTVTRADGRWAAPLYLDPGVAYALTFAKPGVYRTSRQDLTL